MIRLAMALSTFSGKMDETECCTEEGFDNREQVWSTKYISQMEPTVYYLLENYDEDLEIVLLCSKETYSFINGMDKDSYEFFSERIQSRADLTNSKVRIVPILLDNNNSVPGIRETARYFKEETVVGPDDKLWIDIHGGYRDISLTFNAIISLLKVYEIKTDKVVTVQWSNGKASVIKDVTDSFNMFDFVSGMNEFIQYGSADTLLSFDNEYIDKSILESIRDISDGTKLCDPYLYKKGLVELGKRLSKGKQGKYTDLFEQYIRNDYGELLDKPTNLGIVKRCYKKKMYQQALTFIESLMPESIVENKVIYYNDKETKVLKDIQKVQGLYKISEYSVSSFLVDNYIYRIKQYLNYSGYSDPQNEKKMVLEAIQKPRLVNGGFISDDECIEIEKKDHSVVGKVYIYSDLKKELFNDAGKLLRLHKALKNCRNMSNHAQEDKDERPRIKDIDNTINYYIELAEKVFNPDNREIVKHIYRNSVLLYERTKKTSPERYNG